MHAIHESIFTLIGNTPMLRLNGLKRELGFSSHITAKLESFNPGGSVKDRVALSMINDARQRGLIADGATIIEPTSGNTGIGIALICAVFNYKAILVMPENMSDERKKLLRAYGASLILTDKELGMQGAIERAIELTQATENSFMPSQFDNPANKQAHYYTTAPEIWEETRGELDIFVAGVGTGGTITGIGEYLKHKKPGIRVVAVEPEDSAVLSGQPKGVHGLQGIGAGFIPNLLDTRIYDEVITVAQADALSAVSTLARADGLFCGISSGAAIHAAITLALREPQRSLSIVVLLPDSGERYLSVLG